MLEVADIVRLHGDEFRAEFGSQLSGIQKKALRDIQNCRTPFFGGHVHQCDHCAQKVYSYHSCRNRSCPKCHRQQTDRWLAQQQQRLLPCPYYLVTFTLPAPLRALARSHPKIVYGLLMKTAAAALQKLADDPRFLGARLGMLAVLHTWTRAMLFHPHVHMLVTAGGLSADGQCWRQPKNPKFLVPVRALSLIFRGKLRTALHKAGLLHRVASDIWQQAWVVHCQHAGSGDKVLQYLGRYVFRIALSNNRLERIQDGHVTFNYRDNQTRQIRHVSLSGPEFLHRFLQHVLPRGSIKIRYYGIFSPHCQPRRDHVRRLIPIGPQTAETREPSTSPAVSSPTYPAICPYCRVGKLVLLQILQCSRSP
jgi:putative transposase/transposase-like zinc-binding protein